MDYGDLSQRFVGANASAERAKNRLSIDASGRLKPCLGGCESKPAAERGGLARVQKKRPAWGVFCFNHTMSYILECIIAHAINRYCRGCGNRR